MTERLTYSGTKEAKPNVTIKEVTDKLAHYEDLEEQGRLIELPCAVGDTVYIVYSPNRLVEPYTFKPIKIESLTKLASYIEKMLSAKPYFYLKGKRKQKRH